MPDRLQSTSVDEVPIGDGTPRPDLPLWTERQVVHREVDELAEGAVEMFWGEKRSVSKPRPRLRISIELELKEHRRLPERRRALLSDEPLEIAGEPPPRLALGNTSTSADRQRRLNRTGLSHPHLVDRRAFPCVRSPRVMRSAAMFAVRGHTPG
jgi:hypothetical protein